eukprot:g15059.t1
MVGTEGSPPVTSSRAPGRSAGRIPSPLGAPGVYFMLANGWGLIMLIGNVMEFGRSLGIQYSSPGGLSKAPDISGAPFPA